MSRVYTNTDTKQNAELLCDIKKYDNGREKEQPWRPKKVRTLVLADCFAALGEEKRAERIRYCGTNLQFRQNIASGKKRLTAANFCKERLCPMCGWRRSIKMYNQVSRIMDWCDEQRADLLPIFLTLTVRNCSGEELGATLDSLFSAWKKLMQRRNIKRQIVGWFRALEVTYSEKERNWHPHFHVILLVEKSYFSKSNSEYLRTSDWVKAWRESLQIDYDPVCDARRAGKDGRRKKRSPKLRSTP